MKKKKKIIGFICGVILLILLIGGGIFYQCWKYAFSPNVIISQDVFFVHIPTNSTFQVLKDTLTKHHILIHPSSFQWLAEKKHFTEKIPAGRYKITNGMSNNDLINKIRSGTQDPVNVMFNNIDNLEELAQCVSRQIEADDDELLNLMSDSIFLQQFGVTPTTVFTLFIPNTYQFYWNTSAKAFINRMKTESDKFWNADRQSLAKSIQLSRNDVVTLASIVEKETSFQNEKATIAGVYMNRLHSNWPLQADPTLKFAVGDPTLKRILNSHKLIDSPYNTYLYLGLPPGPICLPSISSIDGVFHYERSYYYYFCAKPDLSGHVFSKTLAEHNRNAAIYRKAQFNH
ncbi:MAG: endolytic transglycosylase MltG [Bacteroidales bacterium]|nr:endolytic transglycosylase MltG [Bacteroidales bacterium]